MIRIIPSVAVLLSPWIFAQSKPRLAFEVATIKPAASTPGGGHVSTSGDRIAYTNTTLMNALAKPFQVQSADQIVGPSWIFTDRYDIVAQAPDHTPKERIPLMLQSLLIERFQLTLHHENRDLPAYALVLEKGPLKLVRNEDETNQKAFATVRDGHRDAKGWSMATLAQFASLTLRRPVLDMTGLPGHYDFPYDYSLEETGGTNVDSTPNPAPSIFTIVAGLGLKLESRKAPFDVIVIDSGDKVPAGN